MLKKIFQISVLSLGIISVLTSCNTSTLFTPIGTHFSAPIDVAVDVARNRAYVINSNTNYAFLDATLSILDITNPIAPTLLSSTANPISIPNFSSQIYLDTTAQRAFVTNRLSTDNTDTVDALLRINVDETSGTFGAVESFNAGDNPFGMTCCDLSGNLYVVNGGTLGVYDFDDLANPVSVSLSGTLLSGSTYSGVNSVESVFIGTQSFITNRAGRIYVINTTEVGDATKNPIDYLIINVGDARGIVTDGTLLYMLDGSVFPGQVRIINPATLTPVVTDVPARPEIDVATIESTPIPVGGNPNKIIIFNGNAYVSNQDDDTVSVIDLVSRTVIHTISVGDRPFGLTAFTSGANNYLYVTNLFSNSISIIDLASNTVVATFTL